MSKKRAVTLQYGRVSNAGHNREAAQPQGRNATCANKSAAHPGYTSKDIARLANRVITEHRESLAWLADK